MNTTTRKVATCLTFDPTLLAELDGLAAAADRSRSYVVSHAIRELLGRPASGGDALGSVRALHRDALERHVAHANHKAAIEREARDAAHLRNANYRAEE